MASDGDALEKRWEKRFWNEQRIEKEKKTVLRTVALLARSVRRSDAIYHQCVREQGGEFDFGEYYP
jgi:hypothetical protein